MSPISKYRRPFVVVVFQFFNRASLGTTHHHGQASQVSTDYPLLDPTPDIMTCSGRLPPAASAVSLRPTHLLPKQQHSSRFLTALTRANSSQSRSIQQYFSALDGSHWYIDLLPLVHSSRIVNVPLLIIALSGDCFIHATRQLTFCSLNMAPPRMTLHTNLPCLWCSHHGRSSVLD